MQTAELAPSEASRATYTLAAFLREQFDVQTMAQAGYPVRFGRRGGAVRGMPRPAVVADDTRQDESRPYAVSTLREDETIARPAHRLQPVQLPDEIHLNKDLRRL